MQTNYEEVIHKLKLILYHNTNSWRERMTLIRQIENIEINGTPLSEIIKGHIEGKYLEVVHKGRAKFEHNGELEILIDPMDKENQ